ncbi:MAG: 16S rRNA (cytosine(1402)-N(4))-methyltransferase RsmH [Deltaproteobacteria bacterium]|nr:16S rRNA (cytosine(1402)-N(4))-methyltransferase RsmH [Deltaproteobacteria bacterium]
MEQSCHISVLKEEVVELLRAAHGGRFLDCTLGGGGHVQALLNANSTVSVVAADRDARAIIRANRRFENSAERCRIMHSTFSELKDALKGEKFDGILADLGLSTDQLKESRGFSFSDKTPLDMRMDESQEMSASHVVNKTTQRELVTVLRKGGVGKEAVPIAAAIIKARPIKSTDKLSETVSHALKGRYREKKGNPATVVFQAIRIAVNREFEELEALLDTVPKLIKPKGRLAVISFHSLEDKVVAHKMRQWQSQGRYPALWRGPRKEKPLGKMITKKAVVPQADELRENPAARSARLRVFEFE